MLLSALRFIAALAAATSLTFAGDGMPIAQQNDIVQTYCAVCHTDASMNGGLSLEHFDAATGAPSLRAMMLSKITSGALLETVYAAASRPAAAAFVQERLKNGAMAASGVPEPDPAVMQAFATALALGAERSSEWILDSQPNANQAPVISASMLREAPSPKETGVAESYRVILACNAVTRQGTIQVTWSPGAKAGKLLVAVDSRPSVAYVVSGTEVYGNGKGTQKTLASLNLTDAQLSDTKTALPLPERTLSISDSAQTVTFPFDNLSNALRKGIAPCFPAQSGQL